MKAYMARRAFHSVFILLGLMALLFVLTRLLGDPTLLMLPDDATQEDYEALRARLGFDRPLHVQFGDFYWDAVRLDFGNSIRYRTKSIDLVKSRLPKTAQLAVAAWTLGLLGIPLGILAANRPRSFYDRLVSAFSFAAISIPGFWLALMLILLFAVTLGWLPTSGFSGYTDLKFMILPVLTLLPGPIGIFAQLTRTSMIEEISKPYVTTATAKGLGQRVVTYRHVLKNSSIAIVTLGGTQVAGFMNGSTITETIFAWPGMGLLLITAISARDLPVVTAAVFVIALIVLAVNLIVDLLYAWLDPRIRYQ